MKRLLFIIATMAIAILAATAVSCKKDKQDEPTNNERSNFGTSTFTPPQVDDMNAYLKAFKEKMQSSKEDVTMGLDEAAWHLSCLANHDFCNINVYFNNYRFDTLYSQIELTDEQVCLQKLGEVYDNISRSIEAFERSLYLEGKHFRFIDAKITPTGQVIVPILTTFITQARYLYDTLWYFNIPEYNTYYIDSLWLEYYESNTIYPPNGWGRTELERVINMIEDCHPTSHQWYFTLTAETFFYFRDYIDPYGSNFIANSRLYAAEASLGSDIGVYDMIYLTDSYLGLGEQACPQGSDPVWFHIIFHDHDDGKANTMPILNHELDVKYGIIWTSEPNNPGQD